MTDRYDIYDLGYNKSLVKNDNFYNEVPRMKTVFEGEVNPSNVGAGEFIEKYVMKGDSYQSENFQDGVAGWKLGKTTSEFIDVIIRGLLLAANIHVPNQTDANSLHIDSTGLLWAGANEEDKAIAPIKINPTGEITLGRPDQAHLQISGPNKRIRSSDYVTGESGFNIDKDLIEATNMIARGLIKTANFQKGIITSIGGMVQINKGSDTLNADMTVLDSSQLTIKGTETFAVNDILRIKEGTDDEWLMITDATGAPTYVVTRDLAGSYGADSNPTWKKGATVVNYGQSGQGYIEISAADTNMPWIKVKTHTGSPWSTTDTKVIIGQLKDKTGADEYGFWIKSGAAYIAGYRLFEAVVDVGGNGDYSDIQSAIDAGKKRIFVRAGTYTLSADIILDSDILLQGENKYTTIINLNGDRQIKAIGDVPYTTGSISVTNGSLVITGTGTFWLSNLAINDYIIFNGNICKITAVVTNTYLTIEVNYQGATQSGVQYKAGTFKHDIKIENITVTGQELSTYKGAIYFHGVVKSEINNAIIVKNDFGFTSGINWEYCYNNILSNIVSNNNNSGIFLYETYYSAITDINANNNRNSGITSQTSSNNLFSKMQLNSNKAYGLYVIYSENSIFEEIIAMKNGEHGVRFNGQRCVLSNNIIRDNSQTTNNGYSEIFLFKLGDYACIYNIISHNNIYSSAANKAAYGIREDGVSPDCNYNLVHGNIVQGAVTANISLIGANSVNADNIA